MPLPTRRDARYDRWVAKLGLGTEDFTGVCDRAEQLLSRHPTSALLVTVLMDHMETLDEDRRLEFGLIIPAERLSESSAKAARVADRRARWKVACEARGFLDPYREKTDESGP